MAEGTYFLRLRKISFPRIASSVRQRETELRTNDSFRTRFQPQHHHMRSILEDLPIDMIIHFPTSEGLHIIINRLLLMWLGYIKGHQRQWTKREVIEISQFLKRCNETRPSEIHRSIRSLDCIKHWKAYIFALCWCRCFKGSRESRRI